MKQRDEIIKKLKKKFGVDQEEALRMLIMPDPSMDPEKQMEIISGGKLAQKDIASGEGIAGGQAAAAPTQEKVQTQAQSAAKPKPAVGAASGMQREFSAATIATKATLGHIESSKMFDNAASRGSLSMLISPSFRFGLYTNKNRELTSSALEKHNPFKPTNDKEDKTQ